VLSVPPKLEGKLKKNIKTKTALASHELSLKVPSKKKKKIVASSKANKAPVILQQPYKYDDSLCADSYYDLEENSEGFRKYR
jgi:hypothetical protein